MCQLVTECIWGPRALFNVWLLFNGRSKCQHFRIYIACRQVLLFKPALEFLPCDLLLLLLSVNCEFFYSRYWVGDTLCHHVLLNQRGLKVQLLFEVLKGHHTQKVWEQLNYRISDTIVNGFAPSHKRVYLWHLVWGHFTELSFSELLSRKLPKIIHLLMLRKVVTW
jgi:hypothetical protein